jgi:glycosyltransferase involved in cell wall biosynthesis
VKRRVLYFHHGGAIGGAPLSLLYLLERMNRAEYEPIVLTLRPGPATALFESAGIDTHVCEDMSNFSHTELEWYGGRSGLWRLPLQVLRFRRSIEAARREIRRFRPDLVHVNSSTLAAAARAARLEHVPCVWHVREPLANGYLGWRRHWLQRRIRDDGDRVIAISHHDAGRLLPSPRTRVIYNFVDFRRFDRETSSADSRRGAGIPLNRPVVSMLGGVAYAKGTLTLVRAAALVRRRVPDVLFIVAGGAPSTNRAAGAARVARLALGIDAYDSRVSAAAASLVASGHLTFAGVQRDVVPTLALADVLVFPSAVPHFGRPLIEAAAMAVPVVASNLGASPELVQDGVTGHLVPAQDPSALADAIGGLLENRDRAREMGEAGYRRALRLFNADVNARATFDVYRELLG